MKYLVRFEVKYVVVVNEELNYNDLQICAFAAQDCIKKEVIDSINIKLNHVEPLEDER